MLFDTFHSYCASLLRKPYIFLSHARSFQKNLKITLIVRDIYHASMTQHKVHILFVRPRTKDRAFSTESSAAT